MSYKLICIDMDGTLLNSRHEVSKQTKEIIRKAHEKGVHIVITTGRLFTNAEAYSDLIGVKSPIIASNGAVIRGINKNEIIYKSILDNETCIKLLEIFAKQNVKPTFFTPKKIYVGSLKFKLFFEFAKLMGKMGKKFNLSYVSSRRQWLSILSKEKNNIVKGEVIDMDVEKLKRVREELINIDGIEIVSSSRRNIEITKKGVSKGRAIERLAEHYNIKRDEIIAIGDSENDLSMIEFAGMGIAMGNAIEAAKKKADYITDTNDNDGVVNAISKFVL